MAEKRGQYLQGWTGALCRFYVVISDWKWEISEAKNILSNTSTSEAEF